MTYNSNSIIVSALQNFFANAAGDEHIVIVIIMIITMYALRDLSSVHFNECALLFAKCCMLVCAEVQDFKRDIIKDEVQLTLWY